MTERARRVVTVPRSLLLVACLVAARTGDAQTLRIVNATVVDVRAGELHRGSTIVVQGNRITSVGADTPTSGGQIVDATGKYVIPGLWDMHTHAFFGDRTPESRDLILPLFIANGVTGIRDMHTFYPDPLKRLRYYRAGVADGSILGPRIVGAGFILGGPGDGTDEGFDIVRTEQEGRRAVDTLARGGADFVKVYDGLSPNVYRAIVDEAHRRGLPVAGHVPYAVGATAAADAGQRTLEHLFGVLEDCSPERDAVVQAGADLAAASPGAEAALRKRFQEVWRRAIESFTVAECKTLFDHLRRNGTFVTPTLVLFHSDVADLDAVLSDPRLRYVPRRTKEAWTRDVRNWRAHHDPALMRRASAERLEVVAAMQQAGIGVLAGTDIFNAFTYPGFSLHDELKLLTSAGLTPAEALRSATLNPARLFGATDSLGTIQPGKLADLVLLAANPLADISNTQRISAVVVDGRYLDRRRLDALLAQAERVAAASR